MSILKKTYLVDITPVSGYFELCEATKFPIVSINGVEQKSGDPFKAMESFPNPAANFMVKSYDSTKRLLGEKLAKTIVVYLSKYTKEPVLMLFPNNKVLQYTEHAEILLNHDSRKDFRYQMAVRTKIAKINGHNK